MAEEKPKNRGFFSKIETRVDALQVIKEAAYTFYIVGGLQIIVSFIIGFQTIIDGVLFIVFGFLLHWFNSRIAAVILLLLSGGGLAVTAINQFGGGPGGRNIFLALIVFWMSVRATQATFKLESLPPEQEF